MKKTILCLGVVALANFSMAGGITYPSGLAGAWEFDNAGDLLHADTGNDLTLTGSHTAVAGADGGAVEIGVGSYYRADHNIAGNGGSTDWVNDYTILMDIKVPAVGVYISLFQTDVTNTGNDGEAFVHPTGIVGVGDTGYSSTALVAGTWYRLAISVSLGDHYSIYLDGTSILEAGALPVDGRFALFSSSNGDGVLFFADNDGEDNLITVDRLAIFGRDLSEAEIAAMGAPFQPEPEYVFIDTFNTANTNDINADLEARQSQGLIVPSPYSLTTAGYSIVDNKLSQDGGIEWIWQATNFAEHVRGEDFELAAKVQVLSSQDGWTELYLHGTNEDQDLSHFGVRIYGSGEPNIICTMFSGVGSTATTDLYVGDFEAAMGGSYDRVAEHTYQLVSTAGNGITNSYDLVVDGVTIRSGFEYAIGGGSDHIWMGLVKTIEAGSNVFYDDIYVKLINMPSYYEDWLLEKGLTAGLNGAHSDDPDVDGLNNLLEYALGGDPLLDDAASLLPTSELTLDAMEYIYNRRLDAAERGLEYGLNVNTNGLQFPSAWTNMGHAYETTNVVIDLDFESVTNIVPTDSGMGFINLKVAATKAAFTLYQLPTHGPGMSYVLVSEGGRVVVIDGGSGGYWDGVPNDGPFLKSFLEAHGGHVDAWFISHPHDDHVDALIWILENPGGLKIDNIYGKFPPVEWDGNDIFSHNSITNFNNTGKMLVETQVGDTFDYDEIHVEVLSDVNLEITGNGANNSSIAYRINDPTKTILFLGDLGSEGGAKLLANVDPSKLRADYVQVAHHGSTGVDENVYQAIQPKYGLWPTPIWLWTNNDGTGPYTTLETRQWFEDLNVIRNYVSGYGISEIR